MQIDPMTRLLQQRAEDDRIRSIQENVSDATRDNLIRYGRRKLFSGANLSPGGSTPGLGSLASL